MDIFNIKEKAFTPISSGDASYLAQLGTPVSPEIIAMNGGNDKFASAIRARDKVNNQTAETYTQLTSVDFLAGTTVAFAEGGCPNQINATKIQKTVLKKSIGICDSITEVALAGINSCSSQGYNSAIMSEQERLLRNLDISFREGQDKLDFDGDSTLNPLEYDGLKKIVTGANGAGADIDLAGATLTKAQLDTVIAVQMSRNITPTMIVAHPMLINHILNLYTYTNGASGQLDIYGNSTIFTPAGQLKLVADKHAGYSAGVGNLGKGDVFVLTDVHAGVDLIYHSWLIKPKMVGNGELSATQCTSTKFCLWGHGALVVKAPIAQAVIRNAGFASDSTLHTVLTTESASWF